MVRFRGISSGKEVSKRRKWLGSKLMGERGTHSVPGGSKDWK